jgi:hypothetical protein
MGKNSHPPLHLASSNREHLATHTHSEGEERWGETHRVPRQDCLRRSSYALMHWTRAEASDFARAQSTWAQLRRAMPHHHAVAPPLAVRVAWPIQFGELEEGRHVKPLLLRPSGEIRD